MPIRSPDAAYRYEPVTLDGQTFAALVGRENRDVYPCSSCVRSLQKKVAVGQGTFL